MPLAVLALALAATLPPSSAAADAPDAVVFVPGDDALMRLAAERRWPGSGAPGDPYVIANLEILANASHGIWLKGTTKHVAVRNVNVSAGGGSFDGVRIESASNVLIEESTFEGNLAGIRLLDARDVVLRGNVVKSSAVGVALEGTTGAAIEGNRIALNGKDMLLRASWGNLLRGNNLSIATGQTALWFEDEASYDNRIERSNVVNGEAVHWYAREGSPDAPLVVQAPRSTLRGVTNVAQIMLYRVSNATVSGAVARDGNGAGIQAIASTGVLLVAPV
ncbi:MAG TPA: right-handed parallel beta-helix repeat-containing protein, partial [Candidatus Thermoplasmatota archaeon]|nr:right-handed parallel beta-helix repeat-containing protein [Candidatus Thermoplasmatota archaeon]